MRNGELFPGLPLPLLIAKRRLAALKRGVQRRWYEAFLTRPADVAHRWERGPMDCTGRECCLFVTYVAGSTVCAQAVYHARAWADQGFAVTLIVCIDDPAVFEMSTDLDFCAAILVRKNSGYDFGAWASAICLMPSLDQATRLVTVNDSIYGPLHGFGEMVRRLRATDADLCGILASSQFRPHLQSFLLAFGPRMVRHPFFWRFWRGVRVGGRQFVIRTCELDMLQAALAAGLTAEALFPDDIQRAMPNRTLSDWRALIDEGFPYIKAQLLRENPFGSDISGWQDLMRQHGYDPAMADAHLGSRPKQP